MAWYRQGTVSINSGSNVATLTGGDARYIIPGDTLFIGTTNVPWEVAEVTGNTTFTLVNYTGPTVANQTYKVQPTGSTEALRKLRDNVSELVTSYRAIRDTTGRGEFPSGSAASPGVRGVDHKGSGISWNNDGTLTFSQNGIPVVYATTTNGAFTGPVRVNDQKYYLQQNGQFSTINFDDSDMLTFDRLANALVLNVAGTQLLNLQITFSYFGASFLSLMDGGYDIGHPNYRWRNAFFVNSPIITSDERDKNWLGGITEAHVRAAKRIVAEIGMYRWHNQSDERVHFGVRAQKIMQIMIDEGLEEPGTNFKHAFLCYQAWPAADETDNMGAVEAGDRYGVRYEQLSMFLFAALMGSHT